MFNQAQFNAAQFNATAGSSGPTTVPVTLGVPVDIDTRIPAQLYAAVWVQTRVEVAIGVPVDIDTHSVTIGVPVWVQTRVETVLGAPVDIDTATDFGTEPAQRWCLALTINGVDHSAYLTGTAERDWRANAATLLDVELAPTSGTIDPADYDGHTLRLEHIEYHSDRSEAWRRLVFEGQISNPTWSPDTGRLQLRASSDMQGKFDRMTREQIDAVLPGAVYSDLVYDAGHQGWEYAQDRLDTMQADLWPTLDGAFVSVPWAVGGVDIEYGDSDVITGSDTVTRARRRDTLNLIYLNIDYRHARLRQRTLRISWQQPWTMCEQLRTPRTLCQRAQVESAANGGAGWQRIGTIDYIDLPAPQLINCIEGQYAWGGGNDSLCMGAAWTAVRRWSQTVTEQYRYQVRAAASITANGELPSTEAYGIYCDYDASDWINAVGYSSQGAGFATLSGDAVDEELRLGDVVRDATDDAATGRAAFDHAQQVALASAVAEILRAHRSNKVTWRSLYNPRLSPLMTVRRNGARLRATGRVERLRDRWVIAAGSAETEITLTVSRAGALGVAEQNPVEPVATTPAIETTAIPTAIRLPTHVGGLTASAAYRDDWTGYITNYEYAASDPNPIAGNPNDPDTTIYPNQFVVEYPPVEGEHLATVEQAVTHVIEVDVPNDELVQIQQ